MYMLDWAGNNHCLTRWRAYTTMVASNGGCAACAGPAVACVRAVGRWCARALPYTMYNGRRGAL